MSETAESTVVQRSETSASNNWDALNSSKQFGNIELVNKQEKVEEEKKETSVQNQVENKTEAKEEVKKEEVKDETKTEEKVEEKKEEKTEAKVEEKPLEFTPEDVGLKPEAEDGSWLKVAQELKLEGVEKDSFEDVQAAFENKLKAAEEKGRSLTKDALLSEMKPEVALALKRIEAGMKPEIAVNPTGHIEATIKLGDAEIVRADLELREGWDAERIDTHMEILSENPKRLAHEASIIRDDLKVVKSQVEAEANQFLQTYEQNKQAVVNQRLEAQKTQILEALKSTKEFLGGKVLDATTQAIVQNFNQGGYDNILNDPKAIAEFINYKTFGEKAIKAKLEAEYQRGKLEKAKDLANVPPVGSKTGNQTEQKINQINNWDALNKSKEFGEK